MPSINRKSMSYFLMTIGPTLAVVGVAFVFIPYLGPVVGLPTITLGAIIGGVGLFLHPLAKTQFRRRILRDENAQHDLEQGTAQENRPDQEMDQGFHQVVVNGDNLGRRAGAPNDQTDGCDPNTDIARRTSTTAIVQQQLRRGGLVQGLQTIRRSQFLPEVGRAQMTQEIAEHVWGLIDKINSGNPQQAGMVRDELQNALDHLQGVEGMETLHGTLRAILDHLNQRPLTVNQENITHINGLVARMLVESLNALTQAATTSPTDQNNQIILQEMGNFRDFIKSNNRRIPPLMHLRLMNVVNAIRDFLRERARTVGTQTERQPLLNDQDPQNLLVAAREAVQAVSNLCQQHFPIPPEQGQVVLKGQAAADGGNTVNFQDTQRGGQGINVPVMNPDQRRLQDQPQQLVQVEQHHPNGDVEDEAEALALDGGNNVSGR